MRHQLQQVVAQHGGSFSRQLDRDNVTHLVATKAEGDKHAAAVQWKLSIVTPDWVSECASQGVWLPEDGFSLDKAISKQYEDQLAPDEMAVEQSVKVSSSEQANEKNSFAARRLEMYAQYEDTLSKFKITSLSTLGESRQRALENEVFFFCGFSPTSMDVLVSILCITGAIRHHMLTDRVTRILLGGNESAGNYKYIQIASFSLITDHH